MQDENRTHAQDSAMPQSQQMECYHSLKGFGHLFFELIYNKSSGSTQHNSTAIIFAPQIIQNREKKGNSNMTLN